MPHPFQSFGYCPRCGSSSFVENNFKSKRCLHCGFVYYFNPSAAVAAFITNPSGQVLFAKRAKDPARGSLDLPGGFVDALETAEEAVCREIQEETGLVLSTPLYCFSLPNVYPYSGFNIHTLDMFFEAQVTRDEVELQAADDVEALFWLAPEAIQLEEIGLPSIQKGVQKWLVQRGFAP